MAISFIVPTHREDRPLRRCLLSIAPQLRHGDEVIVVGDTHDGPLPGVEKAVSGFGSQFKYLSFDAGHHCYGHCPLNYAISQAQGDYINVNDDDDVWTNEAALMIRQGASLWPGAPMLFRFRSQFGTVYWDKVGRVERDFIGGHCLVAPNVPGKLGTWGCAYSGDFDWVEGTVNAHGGPKQAIWIDSIIAWARP